MKLRINGNSIRLRLAKSEIDTFKTNGMVKDQIQFGTSTLTYILEVVDLTAVSAEFDFNTIRVGVPAVVKDRWMLEAEVGFDATIELGEDELYVLVEKDFQCLVPRKEDETDLYHNPLSK